MRLALFLLASVLLMTADHRLPQLQAMRAMLSVVVLPLQHLVNLPVAAGEWLTESLASRHALQEDNASLRAQHLLLKAQIQKLAALETENLRLRELLDSSLKLLEHSDRVVIAELLAVDHDPYKHTILLDKGSRHGAFVGQPLLDADGVMGQILYVGPFSSTAVLITDPSQAVPVQVNRTGLRTVAFGTGTANKLDLPYVANDADVKEGDLLVTSGLGGRFPPNYPVAVVTRFERNPSQPFATVSATPTAHLDRSREVLLVWHTKENNGNSAENTATAGEREQTP